MTESPQITMIDRIAGATLADGSRVDVTIADGRIAAVTPATAVPATGAHDLSGYMLLGAAAEPHAHLDKALSWDAIRSPMGDLRAAIAAWRVYAETMTVADVTERARTQVLRMLRNGTTAIRTHVDVLLGDAPLRGVEALVSIREELAALVDIEIVALAGPDVPTAHLEAALDAGADAVGGASHLADDPIADLHRLLDVAERRGVPVDLHTDEGLAAAVTLDAYARRTRGWSQNRSAGHCVRLGTLDEPVRDEVIAEVVASGVGIIANPITNLSLQGWGVPVATPRGIAPARTLLGAGARFAAGADNVRDPFNPLGRGDALETAMLLVVAAHLTADEAYTAVSAGAREVMGLPEAGVLVGARADLLAVRADSLVQAIAEAPADRLVIRGGRVVAATTTEGWVAAP
ncbi:amidohydrolase family protein [Microbacterium sp. SORGH_AS_0862]|uniref:amidohydrolase family protein n=1 Tax=Microbacterium sp. SORGH_AS_0862 TaxID=3041789 RepID=UPI0027942C66|nr:amidohydrolase family protein [Microbacterium sp. SORGH_AS_0862]MDQ1204322.1 cytosine deaminase [Microbacterium sp. SORGH_AS_0862]